MDEKPTFDKAKCDGAMNRVFDLFDELDLTMFECYWVTNCIAKAAMGIMGEGFREVAAKLGIR